MLKFESSVLLITLTTTPISDAIRFDADTVQLIERLYIKVPSHGSIQTNVHSNNSLFKFKMECPKIEHSPVFSFNISLEIKLNRVE